MGELAFAFGAFEDASFNTHTCVSQAALHTRMYADIECKAIMGMVGRSAAESLSVPTLRILGKGYHGARFGMMQLVVRSKGFPVTSQ